MKAVWMSSVASGVVDVDTTQNYGTMPASFMTYAPTPTPTLALLKPLGQRLGKPAGRVPASRRCLSQVGGAVDYFFERTQGFGALNAIDGLNPVMQDVAQVLRVAAQQPGKYTVGPGGEMNAHYFRDIA